MDQIKNPFCKTTCFFITYIKCFDQKMYPTFVSRFVNKLTLELASIKVVFPKSNFYFFIYYHNKRIQMKKHHMILYQVWPFNISIVIWGITISIPNFPTTDANLYKYINSVKRKIPFLVSTNGQILWSMLLMSTSFLDCHWFYYCHYCWCFLYWYSFLDIYHYCCLYSYS